MKTILKNLAYFAAGAVMLAGCTADIPEPDINGVPQASELNAVIEVDNDTNYVTFSVTNKGVVPMWIFGDAEYDGKSAARYSYAQNGLKLRFRDAGEYTVELKAYNANGTSIGSKLLNFTLENYYHDPFNPDPYMNALTGGNSKEWVWNYDVKGHLGFGPSGTEGLEWWSADPLTKVGYSLYDDILTFKADGTYGYDPVDGKTLVQANSGYKPEFKTGDDDYVVEIDGFESQFSIEQVWNEANIEEIYLVLEPGANLSYIPTPESLVEPRYRLLNQTAGSINSGLKLVIDNGTDSAWHFEFVPETKKAMLAGTGDEGKAWVMDFEAPGHLACGGSIGNPTEWWSAEPGDKSDTALADDVLYFYPDGTYVFDPGEDGMIFVNAQVDGLPGSEAQEADYDLPWERKETTYKFSHPNSLVLPSEVVLGYVPNNNCYLESTYVITELTDYTMTVVTYNIQDDGGYIAWQYKFRARDLEKPSESINGVEFDGNAAAELTLTNGETVTIDGFSFDEEGYFLDSDFFEYVDATHAIFNGADGDYRIVRYDNWLKVMPLYNGELATWENGKALWIIGDGGGKPAGEDGLIGWDEAKALPCVQTGANTYQITLWMKAEGGSIKVFGQRGWGTEWHIEDYSSFESNGFFGLDSSRDNGNIYTENEGTTQAGFYTFTFTANGDMLSATVDKKKETVFNPTSPANMWTSMNYEMSFYYATTSDWVQVDNPGFVADDAKNTYKISLHTACSDQWQCQVAFHTDMSSSADKTYDFYLEMEITEDHPGVTIKLVKEGDDNTFYFADRHPMTASETFVYKKAKMKGIDMEKIALFFDFGGCAAGTEVTVKNIIFQEHQEE